MTLPAMIDEDAPLTEEVKGWVAAHGMQLARALLNELTATKAKLRDAERDRDDLRRRLRDNRGLMDD